VTAELADARQHGYVIPEGKQRDSQTSLDEALTEHFNLGAFPGAVDTRKANDFGAMVWRIHISHSAYVDFLLPVLTIERRVDGWDWRWIALPQFQWQRSRLPEHRP